jgi:hypothetical protein
MKSKKVLYHGENKRKEKERKKSGKPDKILVTTE